MKITLSLAVLALLLVACSADSQPISTSSTESKQTAGQTPQVAYHVTGMKQTARGAT